MSSLKERLIKSSSASALSVIARFAQQFALTPILLASWTMQGYGEWLVISAIPTYIALSDFGFILAGSNELARRASQEDWDSVQEFYDQYMVWFQRWAILLVIAIAALSYTFPFVHWFGLVQLSDREAATIFFLLSIAALISQSSLSVLAGLRAKGRYHVGLLVRALAALFQIGTIFVIVSWLELGAVAVAGGVLAVSTVAYVVEWLILNQFGLRQRVSPFGPLPKSEPMHRYLGMGIEMMLVPLAQALTLQGSIVVVSAVLGPAATAIFGAHRTMSRLIVSLTQLFSNPLLAEAGLLQGAGDRPALTRVVSLLSRVTLWLALIISVGLFSTGPWIFLFWTHGQVSFNSALFATLLLAVVAESLWRVPASIRLGSNRHRPVAWGYLIFSASGLAIVAWLTNTIGLIGAGIGIFLIDIAMAFWTILTLRGIIDGCVSKYVRTLFRPPFCEISLLTKQTLSRLSDRMRL